MAQLSDNHLRTVGLVIMVDGALLCCSSFAADVATRTTRLTMGKNVVVVGTQWGDEGKGKIVDLLTDRAAAVARFQGGHNAGHTLVIGGEKTYCT